MAIEFVDLPNLNMLNGHSYVSLPEGIPSVSMAWKLEQYLRLSQAPPAWQWPCVAETACHGHPMILGIQ